VKALIYTKVNPRRSGSSPKDGRAILTTGSSQSSHGIPVLRLKGTLTGPGYADHVDLGPSDMFFVFAMTAAEFVVACARGKLPPGTGGRIHKMSKETRETARRFLAQWPEGPQLEE
jgi:hypothetical protein